MTHGQLKEEGDRRGPARRRLYAEHPEFRDWSQGNMLEGRARQRAAINPRVPDPKVAERWAKREKRLLEGSH